MQIYTIYMATNIITKRSYIGFDSNWPTRMKSNRKNCIKFQNALQKYGREAFEWTVLYQSQDKDHTLNEMEQYFIDQFDTLNNGYNICKGGAATMLGRKVSKETKKKMSEAKKGRVFSDEHKAALKMSKQCISAETRMKMSISASSRPRLSRSQETKEKIGASNSKALAKNWIITFPNGKKKQISNLNQFCKTTGLSVARMHAVATGKQSSYKGWECQRA